jgi:hypothetical protein
VVAVNFPRPSDAFVPLPHLHCCPPLVVHCFLPRLIIRQTLVWVSIRCVWYPSHW